MMDINREGYRASVKIMGKKEFTLKKMQEYGFWPKDLPTPYERQQNETSEDYEKRSALISEYDKISDQIAKLYEDKHMINEKLKNLRAEYDETWDYEKIRKDVASKIMQESIKRRAERKAERELQKQKITEAWNKKKAENIVFIGKGYSNGLHDKETNTEKLAELGLPIIFDDKSLATLLGLEYHELRFLCYHRDVVTHDHYYFYSIPKKSGGERQIAAPKTLLKNAQRKILELILEKIQVSEFSHGFLKGKSIVSGAIPHLNETKILVNMDIENFFPTITFQRVRGMFKSFGYSGYISSLLAMICTYCERMPLEIKGQFKYVKISDRILPQGSPASPMITNIICRKMDEKINELSSQNGFIYTRYADDMSFSFSNDLDDKNLNNIVQAIENCINYAGFKINRKKSKILKKNNRQTITGIVVNNEELSVPKVWVKRMRAAIFNVNKLKKESGEIPKGKINEISGMACWLQSVNEKRYFKIINEAKRLIEEL